MIEQLDLTTVAGIIGGILTILAVVFGIDVHKILTDIKDRLPPKEKK